MEKRKPSLLRMMMAFQAIFFLLLLSFGAGSLMVLRHREEKRLTEQVQEELLREALKVREELSVSADIAWELLSKVSEEAALTSKDKGKQYFAKQSIHRECADFCRYNPRILYIFAGMKDVYYVAGVGMSHFDTIRFREWLNLQLGENFPDCRMEEWNYLKQEDQGFFLYL
ncbi:MAG: hypothetical protein IKI86_07665, partial [Firmicutes bacterium]|nr:hypothetical protein [Bacillota bacterium]